jgi:5'-phosphate synthase pdxT subunit
MSAIGILAVQGGVEAHARALAAAGHTPILLRAPRDFERPVAAPLAGLVLPGGESTAQLEALAAAGLEASLEALVARGVPVLATCAGLILAARQVRAPAQRSFGWLDVTVERNGWGGQRESRVVVSDQGEEMVLIRAPRIVAVGERVEVLATLDGEAALVRQGNRYGATFHPELGASAWHARVFGAPGAA